MGKRGYFNDFYFVLNCLLSSGFVFFYSPPHSSSVFSALSQTSIHERCVERMVFFIIVKFYELINAFVLIQLALRNLCSVCW